GQVGRHPDPANARPRVHLVHSFPVEEAPFEIGEVDAGAGPETVPAPYARVDVEKLAPAIAGVALELDLDEPRVAHALDHPAARLLHFLAVDRLHVSALAAEVHRLLPRAPCRDRGEHA